MPSVKTWRELLRTPSMRSSQNSPSETVWKSGIALSSGCHLWVKGCEEALFGRLQRSDEDDGDPLQLFSKQFQKGNSAKSTCTIVNPSALRGAGIASETRHAAWEGSTCCAPGWICRQTNTTPPPALALCTSVYAPPMLYIRQT